MSRSLVLQNLMKLAQGIGANPSKFMGTRTNITFLGKGPTKNPLFQGPLGIESATKAQMGDKEALIGAVEDAMAYATAGKLNSIQLRALSLNLQGIDKMFNPPVLPSASITPIKEGIKSINLGNILNQNPEYKALLQHKLKNPRMYPTRKETLEMTREEALKKFPKESHKFFGRPLKDKDFAEIDELVKRGKLPPAGVKKFPIKKGDPITAENFGASQFGSRKLPFEGVDVPAMLDQKTGMSRAIARQILQQDTRLNLPEEVLISLRTGARGEDPIDLMVKYYGRSMENFDEFLNSVNLEVASPAAFAEMVLKHVKLTPQFAHGGLARILEV